MPADFRSSKRLAAVGAALAWVLAAVPAAPSALAATTVATGVTVQTAYENTPISVNMSDAVGYEFTNTTGVTETVGFTDSLPSGVVVDNPPALTNTAGAGTCVVASSAASPGAGSVTLSVQVPSSTAAGVVCTVSVSIVPGTASQNDGPLTDSYSGLTATPHVASLAATPAGLTVLSDPTLSVTEPQNGQVFSLGQQFDASFSCGATDPLDSVNSFFGTDNEGNQIAAGAPIDTVDPGSHTLDVECYSAAGGGYVAQTVAYTVGSYALTAVHVARSGQVSFRTTLPAGTLISTLLDGKITVGTSTTLVAAPELLAARVMPTKAGLKRLRATKGKSVRLELETSFTPTSIGTGDAEITPTAAIKLTRSNLKLVLSSIKRR